jgi:ATP-dependent RNA helicase DeaD
MISKAILWANKIAKAKPLGDKLDERTKEEFKAQLSHMSKGEILEKLLATYLYDLEGH